MQISPAYALRRVIGVEPGPHSKRFERGRAGSRIERAQLIVSVGADRLTEHRAISAIKLRLGVLIAERLIDMRARPGEPIVGEVRGVARHPAEALDPLRQAAPGALTEVRRQAWIGRRLRGRVFKLTTPSSGGGSCPAAAGAATAGWTETGAVSCGTIGAGGGFAGARGRTVTVRPADPGAGAVWRRRRGGRRGLTASGLLKGPRPGRRPCHCSGVYGERNAASGRSTASAQSSSCRRGHPPRWLRSGSPYRPCRGSFSAPCRYRPAAGSLGASDPATHDRTWPSRRLDGYPANREARYRAHPPSLGAPCSGRG